MPPGAERRATTTREWYEENSPGQKRQVSIENLPLESSRVPVLEVRDFGAPQGVILQLDRNFIEGTGYNAKIVAEVTYGVGGASDTFVADWADGTLITIVAQRLTVVARAEQALSQAAFTMGDLRMELTAAVGHGQPSVIMPTYTESLPVLAAGATSAAVRPPAFAKACSVLAVDLATNDPYPNFFVRQTVIAAPWGDIQGIYIAGGAAFPLAPEATVQIVNTGPNALLLALQWHLAL